MAAQVTLSSFGLKVIPQLMDLECINVCNAVALALKT
jgi:hypothetical protein